LIKFVKFAADLIEFGPADDRQILTAPPTVRKFERRVNINAVGNVLALWKSKLMGYTFAPVARLLIEIGKLKGCQVVVSNHFLIPQTVDLTDNFNAFGISYTLIS